MWLLICVGLEDDGVLPILRAIKEKNIQLEVGVSFDDYDD